MPTSGMQLHFHTGECSRVFPPFFLTSRKCRYLFVYLTSFNMETLLKLPIAFHELLLPPTYHSHT